MLRLLSIGLLAAQTTSHPSRSPSHCRAPDGRYVISCYPRGTVVKMQHHQRLRVSATPAAKPVPVAR